jgi:hypothetical protein
MRAKQTVRAAGVLLSIDAFRSANRRPSPDEVVQAVATTVADELLQPLTVLLVTLDRWRAGELALESETAIQDQLEQASVELARRITLFTRARYYTPRRKAGFTVLDLAAAQAQGEHRT